MATLQEVLARGGKYYDGVTLSGSRYAVRGQAVLPTLVEPIGEMPVIFGESEDLKCASICFPIRSEFAELNLLDELAACLPNPNNELKNRERALRFYIGSEGYIFAKYYISSRGLHSVEDNAVWTASRILRKLGESVGSTYTGSTYGSSAPIRLSFYPIDLNREGYMDVPGRYLSSRSPNVAMSSNRSYLQFGFGVVCHTVNNLQELDNIPQPERDDFCWDRGFAYREPRKIQLFEPKSSRVYNWKFIATITPETVLMHPQVREYAEIDSRSRLRDMAPLLQVIDSDQYIPKRRWLSIYRKWQNVYNQFAPAEKRSISPLPLGPISMAQLHQQYDRTHNTAPPRLS